MHVNGALINQTYGVQSLSAERSLHRYPGQPKQLITCFLKAQLEVFVQKWKYTTVGCGCECEMWCIVMNIEIQQQ